MRPRRPGSRRSCRARAGREALAYLERRGLDRATIRGFELGYAPNEGRRCVARCWTRASRDSELVAAGLIEGRGRREAFAHFRHRLMFPIADERGRIVGFGGRALGEARAKYLNTPETESSIRASCSTTCTAPAGGASGARWSWPKATWTSSPWRRLASHRAVAPLGTAVTERQLALLWRLAEAPIVCLDGDRAGLGGGDARRRARPAIDARRPNAALRHPARRRGPDSYLRRHGAEALRSVLSKAHTLSQMVWRLETQGRRFETPRPEPRSAGGCADWPDWPPIRTCGQLWMSFGTSGGILPRLRRRTAGAAFLRLGRRGPLAWKRVGRPAAIGGDEAGFP